MFVRILFHFSLICSTSSVQYMVWYGELSWDLLAHPVTQVIGEQALVDILDLSEVAWTCWVVSTPRSVLGLRMVKEVDLQLALGMNERRNTGSLPGYDIMHRWGVGGSNLGQT